MTAKHSSAEIKKWIVVITAALLHPVLVYILFPVLGEKSNLVIVTAPFFAAWFFSLRLSILLLAINAVGTAVLFSRLSDAGPGDGLPKAVVTLVIIGALCFGLNRLKRYFDKGSAMADELEKLRDPNRP
jgi:hypothetical protein